MVTLLILSNKNVDTLDLYHNSSVDPRAIAISFKQLAENHPDADEIVAMEKRGQDKFLLRAKTTPEANKSELSKEYFDTYNQLKALAEQEVKALMTEKDIQIRKLENMRAAIKFATGFYSAMSSGESIEFAYKLGCSVIQLDGIAEHLTPVLKKK